MTNTPDAVVERVSLAIHDAQQAAMETANRHEEALSQRTLDTVAARAALEAAGVAGLVEALGWLAEQKTRAEFGALDHQEYGRQTPGQRIAAMRERDRARDAAILNARQALSSFREQG